MYMVGIQNHYWRFLYEKSLKVSLYVASLFIDNELFRPYENLTFTRYLIAMKLLKPFENLHSKGHEIFHGVFMDLCATIS